MRYRGLHAPIGFVLPLSFLFAALQAEGQTPASLTQEQLDAFQNLPQEQ
jgi:hypothetical protein